MARTTRSLITEVLRAKALEKVLTLHDGDGLFLIVKTSGKKLWRFRYQRPARKQRKMMGLPFRLLMPEGYELITLPY